VILGGLRWVARLATEGLRVRIEGLVVVRVVAISSRSTLVELEIVESEFDHICALFDIGLRLLAAVGCGHQIVLRRGRCLSHRLEVTV
jgi:hypothetical protein